MSESNTNSTAGIGGLRDVTNNPNSRKDRLALLEQWRKQANSRQQVAAATAASLSSDTLSSKCNNEETTADGNLSRSNVVPVVNLQSQWSTENDPNILEPNPTNPPISAPSPMSATARFRLAREERKRMKQQEVQQVQQYSDGSPSLAQPIGQSLVQVTQPIPKALPPLPPSSSIPSNALQTASPSRYSRPPSRSRGRRSSLGGGALSSSNYQEGTPKRMKSRRMSVSGSSRKVQDYNELENVGRSSKRSRRTSMLPAYGENIPRRERPTAPLPPRPLVSATATPEHSKNESDNESNCSLNVPQQNEALKAQDGDSFKRESITGETEPSVQLTDLKSRIQQMQHRINTLEKEKMELSMSKAPLEARFQQKEDEWAKDRSQLEQEHEMLKNAAKLADEQFRSIEMQKNLLQEENAKYKLDCLKAGLKAGSAPLQESRNDAWSKQIQADREITDLKDKVRNSEDEIKGLKLDKVSLESEIMGTNLELESLFKRHYDLQNEFETLVSNKTAARDAVIQLEALTVEHTATSAQLNAVRADLAATKSSLEVSTKKAQKKLEEEKAKLQFEIQVLKEKGLIINEDIGDRDIGNDDDDVAVLRARNQEYQNCIAELEIQLLKGEQMRRKMHNIIQELRGNIRVFVRTRPFLPGDGVSQNSSICVLSDEENMTILDRESKKVSFKFDKIFPASSGQDQVFQEVSDFVQSAMDGYNVCLFSYGQTGSGKTHTMQGSGKSDMRGIIPRSVEQILTQAATLQSQNWKFTIHTSFLELYNENFRDLLVKSSDKSNVKLMIKRDSKGKSYVEGLTKVQIITGDKIKGLNQLESVISTAARSRSVARTRMNAQSSRSHSIFMLHLRGYNEETKTCVNGSLNLCDLAGSERLDRSGAASDAKRLKETQAINKSLSCLGDVFNALANGASHIPYRNSKLTYLLQDCLSGDGKALMFVNLSPTMDSCHESLCSLKFAQRVNRIELGKPMKNIQRSN